MAVWLPGYNVYLACGRLERNSFGWGLSTTWATYLVLLRTTKPECFSQGACLHCVSRRDSLRLQCLSKGACLQCVSRAASVNLQCLSKGACLQCVSRGASVRLQYLSKGACLQCVSRGASLRLQCLSKGAWCIEDTSFSGRTGSHGH